MADAAPDLAARRMRQMTTPCAAIFIAPLARNDGNRNTGFRFVRIDLLDDIELPIKCVRANSNTETSIISAIRM